MAIITTNDRNYKNIADEIRRLSGQDATYTPAQMPAALQQVWDNGRAYGYENGYGCGYVEGFGYGEESHRQYFWEQYQSDGDRRDYNFAFAGPGWTEQTFWPQHDIVVENGYQTFAYFAFAGSLKERLEMCKVQLRFQGNPTLMNLFSYANQITELGVIDFSAIAPNANNVHIFKDCTALRTIEKLIVPAGQTSWNGWFAGCSALENIRIEGNIVYGGMSFADCPKLTRESMLSIINAMSDRSGASAASLTFGATNLAKLTASEKAVAAGKNWNLD